MEATVAGFGEQGTPTLPHQGGGQTEPSASFPPGGGGLGWGGYVPHHGLAWLPYLWSRFFFPGQEPVAEPIRIRSLVVLLALPALLLYGSLSFHLFEPDE